MRIPESDYNLSSPPAATINLTFTGQNGKRSTVTFPVAMPTGLITSNADFANDFMPAVNTFANTLAGIYALLSSANVDVSVSFTNPFALVNMNVGDWGNGDVFEVASLSVFLQPTKTAVLNIPAPVQTIFMANDGPNRDIINVNSATSGLLLPLMEALADIPSTPTAGGLAHISDGERIDESLGYNGLSHGKRITRKLRV